MVKDRRGRSLLRPSGLLFFAIVAIGAVITFVTGPMWLFLVFLAAALVSAFLGNSTDWRQQ